MGVKVGIVYYGLWHRIMCTYLIEADNLPVVSKDVTADLRDVCKRLGKYKFKLNDNE